MARVKAMAVTIEDKGLRGQIRNISWRLVALTLAFYLAQDFTSYF